MPNFRHVEHSKAPKWSDHKQASGININPGPFVGIVKANTDPLRSGRVQVWIPELGGDPDDDASWRTCNYCTPFYGVTDARDGKDYAGNPHSYGMWFVPPDIGIKVLCTFVNGDPARGYWFGCVPEWPHIHMVPGLSRPVNNSSPSPVAEIYDETGGNPSALADFINLGKPAHVLQQQVWSAQGLLNDHDRGPGRSTVLRETPSSVFGISTPGRPIEYKPSEPKEPTSLDTGVKENSVRGRQGGHSFVMDDGDINGGSQLMRLRTSAGHMILMNDTAGFIYVINSKGTAWVELNAQGDCNMYCQSTFNLNAQQGITLTSQGPVSIMGSSISIQGTTSVSISAPMVSISGSYSTKISGGDSLHLCGNNAYLTGSKCLQISSGGNIDMSGTCITLNSVKATPAQSCGGGLLGTLVGAAVGSLLGGKSKAPSHEPWGGHHAVEGGAINNPKAQPTYGSAAGLPTGAAGAYGLVNNFGSGMIQQSYGGLVSDIMPIIYNAGPQGGTGGQASMEAQNAANVNTMNTTAQSYHTVNNLQNISFGSGAGFNISQQGVTPAGGVVNLFNASAVGSGYSAGVLQNNPGNLQYDPADKYAIGFANGLSVYRTPEDGIAALMTLFDNLLSDNTLTMIQLLAAYFQANVTDNNIISVARYMYYATGVAPSDYINIKDPTTRVAWASAFISYVQGGNRV